MPGNGAQVATWTPITSTSGRWLLIAIATPLTSPPPPTGHDHAREVRDCLEQLEAERALAGDHVGIVERVDECKAAASARSYAAATASSTVAPPRWTIAPSAVAASSLAIGRRLGHEHLARDPAVAGRVGQRLGVVAGAAGDDAVGAGTAERGELGRRSAELERAGPLEVLGLEHDRGADALDRACKS